MARFRPGLVPTLATGLAVAVLVSLGSWQVRRHQWREALLAEQAARMAQPPVPIAEVLADPEAGEWRRARARGRYDRGQSVLVLGIPHREGRIVREGARVLTPLRLEGAPGAPVVLVDRGWIPLARQADFLAGDAPEDPVEVTGLVRVFEMGEPASGPVPRRVEWPRFAPAALQAQVPYRLAPLVLVREDDGSGRLPLGDLEGARPRSPVNHRAYALTWYGLAAAALGTWIGLGLQGAREGGRPRRPRP